MKILRFAFLLVICAALWSVVACVVTGTNPVGALAILAIAVSSWVLVDHLDSEFDRRAQDHDLKIAHARFETWARRDEWLS